MDCLGLDFVVYLAIGEGTLHKHIKCRSNQ